MMNILYTPLLIGCKQNHRQHHDMMHLLYTPLLISCKQIHMQPYDDSFAYCFCMATGTCERSGGGAGS